MPLPWLLLLLSLKIFDPGRGQFALGWNRCSKLDWRVGSLSRDNAEQALLMQAMISLVGYQAKKQGRDRYHCIGLSDHPLKRSPRDLLLHKKPPNQLSRRGIEVRSNSS
jgi:hypothetical protein